MLTYYKYLISRGHHECSQKPKPRVLKVISLGVQVKFWNNILIEIRQKQFQVTGYNDSFVYVYNKIEKNKHVVLWVITKCIKKTYLRMILDFFIEIINIKFKTFNIV